MQSTESTPSEHADRRYAPRRAVTLTLICVLLVGCTGYELLLQLGATAEQYFNSFDFYYDVSQAADFTQKVLGSGGL